LLTTALHTETDTFILTETQALPCIYYIYIYQSAAKVKGQCDSVK